MTPEHNETVAHFLDRCRNVARLRHLAYSTEQNYFATIRRFIYFHGRRHCGKLGTEEIRAFLAIARRLFTAR